MSDIDKAIRDEVARSVERKIRRSGLASEIGKLAGELRRVEKRLRALEAGRQTGRRAGGQAATPARKPRRSKTDGRTLRFTPNTLKRLRKKLSVTQEEMAKLLDVSHNAVWQWEAGRAKPRSKALEGMRKLRGVGKRRARKLLGESE